MKPLTVQSPRRKSSSCLGCIGSLFGLLILGSIGYLLVVAVLAPWMYFLGGGFHAIPIWQGWGKIQATSGNFVLYILLSQPQTSRLGYPNISGTAVLCTPRGEQFNSMRVIALFSSKDFGSDSNHQPIILQFHNYGLLGASSTDHRPEFDL